MQLSRRILEKEWPLTNAKILKVVPGKGERITVYVDSTEGKYVFKIAHRSKSEATLKRDVSVLHFLETKNFEASPKMLMTRNGRLYARVNGCLVYAMEYIDGTVPKSSPKVWRKFGEALASLHLTKPPQRLRTAFTLSSQRNKMLRLAKAVNMESWYADMWNALPNFNDLPYGMIHTDAALNNVIERPNGSLVFVDWDDAGSGPCVLDIGFVLTSFLTSKLQFEKAKAAAFVKGYTSVRGITKAEKQTAVDAGVLFGLSYSIKESKVIDAGYWRWTQYMADHRTMFENQLR